MAALAYLAARAPAASPSVGIVFQRQSLSHHYLCRIVHITQATLKPRHRGAHRAKDEGRHQ